MWGGIKKIVHKNHNPECRSQEQKQCTHISWHLHRPWTHPEQVTLSLTIFRALVCDSFIQQRLQLTIIQVGHIRILVFCLQIKCNFLLMNSVTQIHEYRFIIHNKQVNASDTKWAMTKWFTLSCSNFVQRVTMQPPHPIVLKVNNLNKINMNLNLIPCTLSLITC